MVLSGYDGEKDDSYEHKKRENIIRKCSWNTSLQELINASNHNGN
jgi:hypothetical protein